jgi:cGMP-dependent protein kinase
VGIDDEFEEVELADLKTIATLGVGGFGRVNLVRYFDGGDRAYALKILNKKHVKEMNQIEHVQNERSILLECRCDFIVRYGTIVRRINIFHFVNHLHLKIVQNIP